LLRAEGEQRSASLEGEGHAVVAGGRRAQRCERSVGVAARPEQETSGAAGSCGRRWPTKRARPRLEFAHELLRLGRLLELDERLDQVGQATDLPWLADAGREKSARHRVEETARLVGLALRESDEPERPDRRLAAVDHCGLWLRAVGRGAGACQREPRGLARSLDVAAARGDQRLLAHDRRLRRLLPALDGPRIALLGMGLGLRPTACQELDERQVVEDRGHRSLVAADLGAPPQLAENFAGAVEVIGAAQAVAVGEARMPQHAQLERRRLQRQRRLHRLLPGPPEYELGQRLSRKRLRQPGVVAAACRAHGRPGMLGRGHDVTASEEQTPGETFFDLDAESVVLARQRQSLV
jgi:hypothetical protein